MIKLAARNRPPMDGERSVSANGAEPMENSTAELEVSDAQKNCNVHVWDTQYFPASKAFSIFRDGICSTFMPWSPEFKSDEDFSARIEGISFDNGSVGRVRMSPLVTTRTKANIASSRVDGFYANFVLSGELKVEQNGRCNVAKPGDLVLYDTSVPVTSTGRPDCQYEDLSFLFAKSSFAEVEDAEKLFGNTLIARDKLISPLATCLTLMSDNILSSSTEEMTALFEACVALLPLAARGFARGAADNVEDARNRLLRRDILAFVNHNLSNEALSPQEVATNFSICPRYVHKIFASLGTTFSCYVTAKRLEHIRVDLASSACRHQPIFALAYRWGFNDVSTFIRVFKKRYGFPPSHFRPSPAPPQTT